MKVLDYVIIAMSIMIIVISFVFIGTGAIDINKEKIMIEVHGKVVYSTDFSDCEIKIESSDDLKYTLIYKNDVLIKKIAHQYKHEIKNIIQIKDKKVTMKHASCPTKQCQKMHISETFRGNIVCTNGISVYVGSQDDVDIIT